MHSSNESPLPAEFATQVVRKLQQTGYQALWAGGCVRDRLLGQAPKDYDVATSATPQQVRELFGKRRTRAVGESFGVIIVLGRGKEGQVEVATFRKDLGYTDGRRPDAVAFSSAVEDAQRRDFTINGMFFDPISEETLDYVGGAEDLRLGIIRAIGDAHQRIAEDKLRMLRAVRFTSTFGFQLDAETLAAIQQNAEDIRIVSAERIAIELRKMMIHENRAHAFGLLRESRLLEQLLPETVEFGDQAFHETGQILAALPAMLLEGDFALPLSVLLRRLGSDHPDRRVERAADVCHRWKLTNRDTKLTGLLLKNESLIRGARTQPWPRLQRILSHADAGALVRYASAVADVVDQDRTHIDFCLAKLRLPLEELDPPALFTGDDLQQMNVPPGAIYRTILESLRDVQLMGQVTDRVQAQNWVAEFLANYKPFESEVTKDPKR